MLRHITNQRCSRQLCLTLTPGLRMSQHRITFHLQFPLVFTTLTFWTPRGTFTWPAETFSATTENNKVEFLSVMNCFSFLLWNCTCKVFIFICFTSLMFWIHSTCLSRVSPLMFVDSLCISGSLHPISHFSHSVF